MTRENSTVPSVTFKIRVPSDSAEPNSCEIDPSTWADLTTDEVFLNKKVVVFSLPGAFTPTCSTFQLPGFEEKAQEFYDKGIDDIYCISVNDSFVMNTWRDHNKLANVKVIPDGNGEFTKEMGMLVDMSVVGFNMRSRRYAMIVNNGRIEKMFIEPDSSAKDPDPYIVTTPNNVFVSL
tara:strand:+ start:2615 stop:3148 length:534 start_codon:yes stop_codon:yes gene_type:complete